MEEGGIRKRWSGESDRRRKQRERHAGRKRERMGGGDGEGGRRWSIDNGQ